MVSDNRQMAVTQIKNLAAVGDESSARSALVFVSDIADQYGDASAALVLAELNPFELVRLTRVSGDASNGSLMLGIMDPKSAVASMACEPTVWEANFREDPNLAVESMRDFVSAFIDSHSLDGWALFLEEIRKSEASTLIYLACAIVGHRYGHVVGDPEARGEVLAALEVELEEVDMYGPDWIALKVLEVDGDMFDALCRATYGMESEDFDLSPAMVRVIAGLHDTAREAQRATRPSVKVPDIDAVGDMFKPL